MSSTTLSSSSKLQLMHYNALSGYTEQTGVDLTKYDFAYGSPDEALCLFRDKAKKFKEYRDGNRKLIDWITPFVQAAYVFSGSLRESTSIVSRKAFIPFELLF